MRRLLATAVLLLLAVSGNGWAAPDDGLAPMPERAWCVLAEALDAAAKGAKGDRAERLPRERASLDALRLVPFPDPTRMERVVVREGKDWSVLGWRRGGDAADAAEAADAVVADDVYVEEVVHRPGHVTEASPIGEEIDEA